MTDCGQLALDPLTLPRPLVFIAALENNGAQSMARSAIAFGSSIGGRREPPVVVYDEVGCEDAS